MGALFREEIGSYTPLYLALGAAYMVAGGLVFLAKPPLLPARAARR